MPPFSCPHLIVYPGRLLLIFKDLLGAIDNVLGMCRVSKERSYGINGISVIYCVFILRAIFKG